MELNRIVRCKNCDKEFELSLVQYKRYLADPSKNNFCSKSCSAIYRHKYKEIFNSDKKRDITGKFVKKEYKITTGICKNCGKQFDLTEYQKKRLAKNNTVNVFCSKSCSAKYSNTHRNDDWKETTKRNNILIYGEEHYVNKKAISKTIKKLYETRGDYGFRSKQYKENLKVKYGVDNTGKSEWIKQHNLEKYGTEFYFQSDEYQAIMETKYNSSDDYYARISKNNKIIIKKLESKGLKCYVEKYIKPYYYDIECNDILIEIDPMITHNTQFSIFNKEPISKEYHLEKTQVANNSNYKCIHIFDWDDIDKIINLITTKKSVYAKECVVKEIDKKQADMFLDKYHLQNSCYGNEYNIALYKDEELIQLMTFGKPRYNKNYDWELLRLCTKAEYRVVGGASKLFRYFIKNKVPSSIISYCDRAKFSGDIYDTLGFKILNTSTPSKHWYNSKTKRHITDNLLRQRGFSQLHNDKDYSKYKKGQSNEILMLENGYLPIYDCGQTTYVYNKE